MIRGALAFVAILLSGTGSPAPPKDIVLVSYSPTQVGFIELRCKSVPNTLECYTTTITIKKSRVGSCQVDIVPSPNPIILAPSGPGKWAGSLPGLLCKNLSELYALQQLPSSDWQLTVKSLRLREPYNDTERMCAQLATDETTWSRDAPLAFRMGCDVISLGVR